MKKTTLEDLLNRYLHLPVQSDRINNLEQNVWLRIRTQSEVITLSWSDKILLGLNMPRFQLLSVSIAIFIGFSLSSVIPSSTNELPSASEATGLDVFSPQAPYLLTTRLMESL